MTNAERREKKLIELYGKTEKYRRMDDWFYAHDNFINAALLTIAAVCVGVLVVGLITVWG